MPCSRTLRRVALVRTDVLEESITRISELITTLVVTNIRSMLRKKCYVRSVLRLLVTANIVTSLPILLTLMMEAIRTSETSFHTRVTWRNIPKDGILHGNLRVNLKSYITLVGHRPLNKYRDSSHCQKTAS
jgi:hypothetical protein